MWARSQCWAGRVSLLSHFRPMAWIMSNHTRASITWALFVETLFLGRRPSQHQRQQRIVGNHTGDRAGAGPKAYGQLIRFDGSEVGQRRRQPSLGLLSR